MRSYILRYACPLLLAAAIFYSCSKSSPGPSPSNPCDGKTIVITATPEPVTACGSGGKITVSATGSTGFTYKLNSGGTYQSSGNFTDLSAGTYTVFAKDGAGCEKTTTVTINSSGTAGPLFTAVKNLMSVTCQGCHNNTIQNGGMNWQVDCNIVDHKSRIKVRAVDEGSMPAGGPPLSQSQKDIIMAWINAGGRFTD